jgi:hypothetical protein
VGGPEFESGYPEIDKGVQPTLAFLSRVFKLEADWVPDFRFFDDGQLPNAFASEPIIGTIGVLVRPAIRVGRKLVAEALSVTNGDYGAALTGIFAHEFAHLFQMKSRYMDQLLQLDAQSTTLLVECHADFLAGWAVPQAFWITRVEDFGVAARQFYALGEVKIEPDADHGSRIQRQSIMASGYTWGLIAPGNPDDAAARGIEVLRDLFPGWYRRQT